MSIKSNQVISIGDQWAVIKSGAQKASKRFTTKYEAIKYGSELSKREETILYIHDRNGMVEDRKSFVKDSLLTTDKVG